MPDLNNDLLINIILVLGLITILHYWICVYTGSAEGFNSYESIQDIASVYNNGILTVNDLVVTNSAKVNGQLTTPNANVTTLTGGDIKVNNVTGTNVFATNLDSAESTTLRTTGDCPLRLRKNPGSSRWNYVEFRDVNNNRDLWMGVQANGQFNIEKESDPKITNVNQYRRTMYNQQLVDGWDFKDFDTDGIDNCASGCLTLGAAGAHYGKRERHCWCKRSSALQNVNNTNFDSVAFY